MPEGPAEITVDGAGLSCARLLLRLRARIADLPDGTVVHVIATDPAAPLDLPAWCHLTGHTYLGLVAGLPGPTFALALTGSPRPTRPTLPWHAAPDGPAG